MQKEAVKCIHSKQYKKLQFLNFFTIYAWTFNNKSSKIPIQ